MDNTELCILIRLQISTRTENPIWQAGFPAWVGGMKLSVPTEKTLCHRKTLLACMGELKFNTSRNLSISSTTKYFECSLIAFLGSRWEKTSRLQPGQPDASVSWDNFIFRLNKKFCPGFQGWIWHVVFFPV